ncbi:YfcC family protein [Photobacterium toruni]|uniref:YfcC family protein n=1 Tax=Photobacterium toruni TaxID=1935446 RepID=UPI002E16EECB|nr:YfcC family protein [Photobacterium toruni]
MKIVKSKKQLTPFTILFILTIIAITLTWIIPSGSYSKLIYNNNKNSLQITTPNGNVNYIASTQESLKNLNISIDIDKLIKGEIKNSIPIPNTYEKVKDVKKNIFDITLSMVKGTVEVADIIIFILILGGMIGVIKKTGALDSFIFNISNKAENNKFLFVIAIFIVMLIGGTTCGLEEEAIAFYPMIVPVLILFGFDAIVCVTIIFLSASIGSTFSTLNPFSVIIASNLAGVSFLDGIWYRVAGLILTSCFVLTYLYFYIKKINSNPQKSYSYENHNDFKSNYKYKKTNFKKISNKDKLILSFFILPFIIMIIGVSSFGWWFNEMSATFLFSSIIIILISGLSENKAISCFITGASELIGVSLIIGLARGINLILEQGMISDTIIFYATSLINGMDSYLFVFALMIMFFIFGFIIPSSSGLAVLTMPIIAPLADTIGVPRDVVVSAYNWGQYTMLYIAPTGLILANLQMLSISYKQWLKFATPLTMFVFLLSSSLLMIQV